MTKTIFGKKLLMLATITVLVTGLTLATTFDDAEAKKPKKEKTTDVSVFSSSVPFDFVTGIFPVGGTGIDNPSDFVVDIKAKKDTAIQVGLKAHDRFGNVPLMDPIGNVYIVPPGESTPCSSVNPCETWNFGFSVDSGTDFLETQLEKDLTTLNLEDFTVILEIKDAEKNKFILDFDLDGANENPLGPIILVQGSQNIGFDFISTDPAEPISVDSEVYKISLTVSEDDGKKGKKVAKSKITVLVTDEVPEDGKLNICEKEKTKSVKVKSVAKHIEKHGATIGACTE